MANNIKLSPNVYMTVTPTLISQSTANNTSVVRVVVNLSNPGGTFRYAGTSSDNSWRIRYVVKNGTTVLYDSGYINFDYYLGSRNVIDSQYTIAHNSNGTPVSNAFSVSISGGASNGLTYGSTYTADTTLAIATIPRYTSITSFTSSSIQRDRFTISWTAANTVNYWWYSLNDGSTWTAVGNPASTTASRTITGLSPGTSYNVKVKVRRSDSNLETASSRLVVTTEAIASPNTPTFSSITRNSFTISVGANKSFNGFQYSLDDGTSWSSKVSGSSVSITGRAANTLYNVRVKVYDGVHTGTLSGASSRGQVRTLAIASPNTPTFSSKTGIQVIFNWSSNRTVTNVQYKRWSSDIWQSAGADFSARTSGSVTITGLSPNTAYSISVRVKDAVHGTLWSGESARLSVTTYALSTVKGTNFNLGSTVTATVTEADTSMYHDIALEADYGGSWKQVASVTNQNKDASLTIPAAKITDIENGTPNSKTVPMRLKVTSRWGSGGTIQGSTTGPVFTATIVNANPTLSGITYKDVHSNTDFVNWKGGDQKILRNVSSVRVILGTATARKGAKLSHYVFTINGKPFTVDANGTATQTGAIGDLGVMDSATNQNIEVTVYDSRNNPVSRSVTVSMIDWAEPQIIYGTGERLNSYEQPTNLNLLARYSRVLVGGTDKNSLTAQYRIKVKGSADSTYGAFVNIVAPKGSVNGIWQEVSSTQFMKNLDENTIYTMHIRYKDYVVGWKDYYVDIEMGVGLMEFFEDRIEIGAPTTFRQGVLIGKVSESDSFEGFSIEYNPATKSLDFKFGDGS